jgi:hypothetical protein
LASVPACPIADQLGFGTFQTRIRDATGTARAVDKVLWIKEAAIRTNLRRGGKESHV